MFAYNSSGYSESSETVDFNWTLPDEPRPVTNVAASATGPTTVRLTWDDDPESDFYVVNATLPGWTRGDFVVGDGVELFDLEGLARGGRYTFRVVPYVNGASGYSPSEALFSRAHLTLGQRGNVPQAPSDLAWAISGPRRRSPADRDDPRSAPSPGTDGSGASPGIATTPSPSPGTP